VKHYLALGDSISIDYYPARETGIEGLGAVSLFYENDDERWPEWRGRDLVHQFPGITKTDLTADGATSDDVLRWQLPRVDKSDDATLVTITAGGNDMLMNLRATRPPVRLVEGMIERLTRIIDQTFAKLPNALILLGTVYDPSDGTNVLYGERLEREAGWLARFNDAIRAMASDRILIADIHRHFLGHGLTVAEEDRWYWSGLIFEPNAKGASEVRRLWWEGAGGKEGRKDEG
jgi:lysophospholipase L1-like esterase